MPGFDRTGPGGYGPRTGWGKGRCNPASSYSYGGGPGMGRMRRGRMGGIFMEQKLGDSRPVDFPQAEDYDLQTLKAEEARLKKALEDICLRIGKLEKSDT